MKKFFSITGNTLALVSMIAALAVLFTACSKFNDNNNDTNTPVAGLMAFNLAIDQPSIGILLSGSNLTNIPLSYSNYTGIYQRIFIGNRPIKSYNYNSDSIVAASNYNFEADKYYSLFVAGADGNYTNIITHDNFDSLSSSNGKAYLRYINAIPDSTKPTVTISANGNNVFDTPADFAFVSDFAPADPGQVSIAVKNNSTVDAIRTITVEKGKVYTILLTGIPGATDTTKAVQIKYIQNGNLTNN